MPAPTITVNAHHLAAIMNVMNLALHPEAMGPLIIERELRWQTAVRACLVFDRLANELDELFETDEWLEEADCSGRR